MSARRLVAGLLCILTAFAALVAASPQALAQADPSRPVRLVVPLAPGGTVHVFGRIVAEKLSQRFARQIESELATWRNVIEVSNLKQNQDENDRIHPPCP